MFAENGKRKASDDVLCMVSQKTKKVKSRGSGVGGSLKPPQTPRVGTRSLCLGQDGMRGVVGASPALTFAAQPSRTNTKPDDKESASIDLMARAIANMRLMANSPR